jgi:membrane dipeptidase
MIGAGHLAWASEFMREALFIDGHCDSVMHVYERGYNLSARNDKGHLDIPRMIEAGQDAQFFGCFIYPHKNPCEDVITAFGMLDALHSTAEKDPRFVIADSADTVLAAKAAGKVACIPAIEGGSAIMEDIRLLRDFRRLGVRYMTLTWNNSNAIADASDPDQSKFSGIPHRGGLTDFGREVVREMNRIGMIVDLSHVHEDTFWDALETSTKPVMVSHSCCKAVNPHYRNITDEMLRGVAGNGGVVGINYFSVLLSSEYARLAEKALNELLAKPSELTGSCQENSEEKSEKESIWIKLPRPPLSLVADHIEHAVRVAGADHVGLGSDFDGVPATPEGLDSVIDVVKIIAELHSRGYGEVELRKILGENFLRVIRDNE